MKIVKKWILRRKKLTGHQKKKNPQVIKVDELLARDSELKISSNLQILNNQTRDLSEQEKLAESSKSLPKEYHDGNCVCLFIMLVFYYLSIITTRLNFRIQEEINKRK